MSSREESASPELGAVPAFETETVEEARSSDEEEDELSEELGNVDMTDDHEEEPGDVAVEKSLKGSPKGSKSPQKGKKSPKAKKQSKKTAKNAEPRVPSRASDDALGIRFSDSGDDWEHLDESGDQIDEENFPAYNERGRLCKYLSVFAECDEERCRCPGFRSAAFTSRRDLFKLDNGVGDLPLSALCYACDHKLASHFTLIRDLTVEDVDRLVDLIDDVDVVHDLVKKAHPFIAAHLTNFYKHSLMALRLMNPNAITDPFRVGDALPPFDRPSVETLMRHYLGLNTPTDKSLAIPMYRNAGRFLTEFNRWRPPLPEFYHLCHIDKAQYEDFLDKWTVHCAFPEMFASLTQYEPVHVFGINALVMYGRFLRRTSKDTEEDVSRKDRIVTDPMSSLEMRQFCRGFYKYIYDARNRNPLKLMYIKPHKHNGLEWPIWDKLADLRDGGVGPETRSQLRIVHKEMKLSDKEREAGEIPHDVMMKACVRFVKNERDKSKDALRDPFLVEVSRGDVARNEEREGLIKFINIKHNIDEMAARENLVWLLQLQNLFSIQLPKMPKEYITRLVFDDRHRNLALIKKDKGVIGGICYRPFKEQGFCEIVFCAITASEQVKGYGTHLMNHIKELMSARYEIPHLLTFADEFATGYFRKQGFTEKGIDSTKVHGFIKEYEGATLMGCTLNAEFNYTNFSGYARFVREMHGALYDVCFPERPENAMYGGIEHIHREWEKTTRDPLPLDKIPGIANNYDHKHDDYKADPDVDSKIKTILAKLKQDQYAWPFQEPVSLDDVPDYRDYIPFPMDFSTIAKRIKEKYYKHERLFIADLNRIFQNCYIFNGIETVYFFCAYKLNKVAAKLVKKEFPDTEQQIIVTHLIPTFVEG